MRRAATLVWIAGAALAAAACEGPTGFTASLVGTPGASGSITGVVTAEGAGLGGVPVIALSSGRDSTATDAGGAYRFTELGAGQYTVSVQVPLGYQLAAGETGTETVTVSLNGTAVADFALQRSPGAGPP